MARAGQSGALVTGGGRGLGTAIVRSARAGRPRRHLHLSLGGGRGRRRWSPSCRRTIRARPSPRAGSISPTRRRSTRLADEIASQPPFSGFVHNAGQSYDVLAVMMDQTKAEAAMQVNFWSFARLVKAVVRPMMRARDGRVAVIGSVTALQANQGNAAYAASKAALLGYMRTLAIEIARTGVTVNYVAPGFIDTEMMAPYAKYRDQMEEQIPARRFATAGRDRRGRRRFCCRRAPPTSPARCLPVDGGLSAAIGIHR